VSEGKQASNLQGDYEVYRMNTLDGKGKKNLTDNRVAVDGIYLRGAAPAGREHQDRRIERIELGQEPLRLQSFGQRFSLVADPSCRESRCSLDRWLFIPL
jgi:hypothetical protein